MSNPLAIATQRARTEADAPADAQRTSRGVLTKTLIAQAERDGLWAERGALTDDRYLSVSDLVQQQLFADRASLNPQGTDPEQQNIVQELYESLNGNVSSVSGLWGLRVNALSDQWNWRVANDPSTFGLGSDDTGGNADPAAIAATARMEHASGSVSAVTSGW